MSNLHRIMWNGTVRALPLPEQHSVASIAGGDALALLTDGATVFLASDDSAYVTGIELFIEGGVAQM